MLVVPIRKKEGEENICEPVSHCRLSEHVLFATDFSETADQAFAHIEHLVPHGGKITLLHVQDKARMEKHLDDRLEEFNKIDKERLERLKALLKKAGAKDVSIEITYGAPKQEIVAYVGENNVSLVVMGSQGRGFIGEMLLGSVSHAVARHSTVPMLLIPAKNG